MSLWHLMLAASLTLATVLVASQVDVRASNDCPSSHAIAAHLRPLLPEGASPISPDVATVEILDSTGGNLHARVRLVRANGSEVGDRRILVERECSEAAATIASVIATWETVPLGYPSSVDPVPIRAPATAMPHASAAVAPTWQLVVGGSGGVGLVGGVAGIGRLEAVAGPRASHFQARLGGAAQSSRTVALSSGHLDWNHTTFEAGILVRTLHPIWTLSLDAGLALGWATLQGRGFLENRKRHAFDCGVVAAVRLGRRLGRWSVWAESRAYGWVQGQRASLPSDNASTDLPLADVTASIGVSASFF
jgi:hypothetical protein